MAKTEKEYTVPEKLGNLYKLQLYVSEIDQIKSLRGELPQEVDEMESAIKSVLEKIEKIKHDITDAKARINTLYGKIDKAQMLIEQYNKQMDEVQNNKQYDFLNKEIEFQNLEIELSNKRINENVALCEELEEKYKNYLENVSERRMELDVKKGELDEIVAETRSEEELLREKAKKIENAIDINYLAIFKRIHKKAKNGLAVVPIENGACCGCFNKITAQRAIDVRLRRRIITCEYCGRILIDEELANENEIRRRRKGIVSQLL